MKTLTLGLFTVALCLSVGCGDDDDDNGAAGGSAGSLQGGKAGAASGGKSSGGAASGGKASGGASSGGASSGGAPSGGASSGGAPDGVGGDFSEGGVGGLPSEGGAGGVPVTPPPLRCDPPTPPEFGAGGASGIGGADGNGGAESAGAPGNGNGAAGLAIRGSFSDNWGSHHVITNSTWTSGHSVFHISLVDNGDQFLIARNDQDNAWNACLWSRFDWTRSGGKLYFCQTAYGAPSEAAALSTPAADPSDPATSGCGGFPWTELVRE